MRIIEETLIKKEILIGLKCDVCNKEYRDEFEIQEFIRIKTRGGYGSKIGDGVEWEIDICEQCFIDKFDEYIVL